MYYIFPWLVSEGLSWFPMASRSLAAVCMTVPSNLFHFYGHMRMDRRATSLPCTLCLYAYYLENNNMADARPRGV
ncbi:hypothetical protein BDV93DRAFT_54823 [Ceratobasidium sp. AG-I]|nr:hypothetical protein BDV93DRAFT_54823 [Ceratobasidium sp. AG-I]